MLLVFIYKTGVGINISMTLFMIFRGWLTKGFEGWAGLWREHGGPLGNLCSFEAKI